METKTMSESIGKLASTLSTAQSQMLGAKADSENPYYKSKYADLASVWDACRKPLTDNKLAVVQTLGGTSENVEIITTLIHESGEWIRGAIMLKPVKADPQGVGSAITYGRRYGLTSILGIIQEDDDGNAASNPPKIVQTPVKTPRKPRKAPDTQATPETPPDTPPKPETPAMMGSYPFNASIIGETPYATLEAIMDKAMKDGTGPKVVRPIIEEIFPRFYVDCDLEDIPEDNVIEIVHRLTGVRMGGQES